MARVPPLLVASVSALLAALVLAAAGLGDHSGAITYNTTPPPPEPPLNEPKAPKAPPASIVHQGAVLLSDPSRAVFVTEGLLWGESCRLGDIEAAMPRNATLELVAGATDGEAEDLDLYLYDDDGKLVVAHDEATTGRGVHHALLLPDEAARFAVCLAGGLDASYRLTLD